jgi:hypothetical protein
MHIYRLVMIDNVNARENFDQFFMKKDRALKIAERFAGNWPKPMIDWETLEDEKRWYAKKDTMRFFLTQIEARE